MAEKLQSHIDAAKKNVTETFDPIISAIEAQISALEEAGIDPCNHYDVSENRFVNLRLLRMDFLDKRKAEIKRLDRLKNQLLG